MPRTAIAVQIIPPGSLATVTFVASDPTNGNYWVGNAGQDELVVNNTDAGAARVATVTSVPCSHGRTGDRTLSQPLSTQASIDQLDPSLYNQSDGTVLVNTAVTIQKLAVVRRTF